MNERRTYLNRVRSWVKKRSPSRRAVIRMVGLNGSRRPRGHKVRIEMGVLSHETLPIVMNRETARDIIEALRREAVVA